MMNLNPTSLQLPGTFDVFTTNNNESEGLLATFCRHYQHARTIHVFDNGSDVEVVRFLMGFPNVKMHLWETGEGLWNHQLTELKNRCWKRSDADWVVVCDIDELLLLAHPVSDEVVIHATRPYNIVSDAYIADVADMKYGVPIPGTSWRKVLAFKPEEFPVTYHHGSHHIHERLPHGRTYSQAAMLHLKFNGKQRFMRSQQRRRFAEHPPDTWEAMWEQWNAKDLQQIF